MQNDLIAPVDPRAPNARAACLSAEVVVPAKAEAKTATKTARTLAVAIVSALAVALVAPAPAAADAAPPDDAGADRTPVLGAVSAADARAAAAAVAADPRRWIAGDLHMHVAPPDEPGDVVMSADDIAAAARAQGLEFVILTPHMHPARGAARRRFAARWTSFAAAARANRDVTLIPGVELGVPGLGHFSLSGVDVAALGDDPLAGARAAGAFIVVNHPFAVPTDVPGVPVSRFDLSFRRWTRGAAGWDDVDGVEVWNLPLSLANVVSRPDACGRGADRAWCGHGGATGEALAFAAADRRARTARRRVTATGGTDNHRRVVVATTWVYAADAGEASILAGLRAGATCVGDPATGALRARGDGDPAGRWAAIGDSVRAAREVALVWPGAAELFVDGVDRGAHDGGARVAVDGGVHTFRIVAGPSRSGLVYANLPP